MANREESGFTLLELIVIVAAGGILLAASISLYQKFNTIHQRQQRVIQVERELNFIQLKLSQSLTTLPGRELGYYSGLNFSIAELPNNGSITTGTKQQPVRLGVVTPFKVGKDDAITVIYGRHNAPRMELIEATNISGGQATARVAVPDLSELEPGSPSANELITKFAVGDLMMLVGGPPAANQPGALATVQAVGRLVRLTAQPRIIEAGQPLRPLMEFSFDVCENGACGQKFPQLTNATNLKSFGLGSALMPINIVSFYLSRSGERAQVMRNDGGTIVAATGGFQVLGGKESFIGEADSLKISYQLEDGSVQPTPNSPVVPWINQIVGVNVEISRSVPSTLPGEQITRTLTSSFPLKIKSLD